MSNISVIFKDYTPEVNAALTRAARNWLDEASGELEAQVVKNSDKYVDTGRTKGSYRHAVDESKLEAFVGSDYENAIWEEFGTGVYAEQGGRTRVPWTYQDDKGDWHKTKGKRPRRIMRNAYVTMKPKLERAAKQIFKQELRNNH